MIEPNSLHAILQVVAYFQKGLEIGLGIKTAITKRKESRPWID
jgi:hypothetical protein